ncbi:MHYT domain-containing protein [Bacillus sp. HU-1818]|uniref:MHYT domain-containing protein n=1 Tax=Bacillus sp. HU-1818 TaxID=2704469 RepID=UPI0037C05120
MALVLFYFLNQTAVYTAFNLETKIHYNSVFILLSIIIACAASYTSLEISKKVTFKTGLKSKLWLFA